MLLLSTQLLKSLAMYLHLSSTLILTFQGTSHTVHNSFWIWHTLHMVGTTPDLHWTLVKRWRFLYHYLPYFIWYKFLYSLGPKTFPVFGQKAKPLSSPLKILVGSLRICFCPILSKYCSSSLNSNCLLYNNIINLNCLIDSSVTIVWALLISSAFLSEISSCRSKNLCNQFWHGWTCLKLFFMPHL